MVSTQTIKNFEISHPKYKNLNGVSQNGFHNFPFCFEKKGDIRNVSFLTAQDEGQKAIPTYFNVYSRFQTKI